MTCTADHAAHWAWVDSFKDYDPKSIIARWHELRAEGHCPCTVEETVNRSRIWLQPRSS